MNKDRDVEYYERIAICTEDGLVSEERAVEIAEQEWKERIKEREDS